MKKKKKDLNIATLWNTFRLVLFIPVAACLATQSGIVHVLHLPCTFATALDPPASMLLNNRPTIGFHGSSGFRFTLALVGHCFISQGFPRSASRFPSTGDQLNLTIQLPASAPPWCGLGCSAPSTVIKTILYKQVVSHIIIVTSV